MMVETVRFARSTDHLLKGSKINFTETIMFHWMWLERASLQQRSHHGLGEAALRCITVWCSDRWTFLHPHQYDFRVSMWRCSRMEQYFSLAPQVGFLPAVYALLAMSGDHLPLGTSSEPGSFWRKRLMLQTRRLLSPMTFTCLARPSQVPLLISTLHVLMQGLLTTPTGPERCLLSVTFVTAFKCWYCCEDEYKK